MSIESNVSDNLPFYTNPSYIEDVRNLKEHYSSDKNYVKQGGIKIMDTEKSIERKNGVHPDELRIEDGEQVYMKKEVIYDQEEWNSFFLSLPENLRNSVFDILRLFVKKNSQYKTTHWASALLNNVLVIEKYETPIAYASNLVTKQDKAAIDLIFTGNRNDEESFEEKGGIKMLTERLSDGVVYRLIMLGLINEYGKNIVFTN